MPVLFSYQDEKLLERNKWLGHNLRQYVILLYSILSLSIIASYIAKCILLEFAPIMVLFAFAFLLF